MKKLAIITTHPIQYYAPVFKLLSKKINIKVFYTWGTDCLDKYDPGFEKKISWDIPLLENYEYEFLNNVSNNPGSHHFKGINNPDIIERVEFYKPDAILVYGYAYQSHLKVMRYFKGKIPIWFRGDSTLLDNSFGLKSIIKFLYLRWVFSYIDKVFYVGKNNKLYFKKYGVSNNKLIFAPHAIDNDRFSKENNIKSSALREKLNIKETDILILFAGKFEPKKDPEILLNAFINFYKNGSEGFSSTHLLFIGNGILEEKLKQQASFFNNEILEKRIHFMDFQNQSNMPTIYEACNIFCLPSIGPGETWGLAINEAMAAGKPILCSDKVGCAKDLVLRTNGLIFKAGNLNDLYLTMRQLLSTNKNHNYNLSDVLMNLNEMGKISKHIIRDWSFKNQIDIFVKEI